MKRKGTDSNKSASKKVKLERSTTRPQPLKSALKKPRVDMDIMDAKLDPSPANTKIQTRSTRTTTKSAPESSRKPKKMIVDDNDNTRQLSKDQTAALLAGFSSSDEEVDDEAEAAIALSNLPKVPKGASVTKSSGDLNDAETTPGVIYIGRVPHGFYEPQMRAYLGQFGDITRLRLARNKKTGRSKHYAFVEFASAAVAEVVVKTMDKYLLFGHLLQVRSVPKEQVSEYMFVGPKSRPVPRNQLERRLLNVGILREDWGKRLKREKSRRARQERKLKELGYDFEMPVLKNLQDVPIQNTDNGKVLEDSRQAVST